MGSSVSHHLQPPGETLPWEQDPLSPILSPLATLLLSPGHAHVPAVFLDQVFGCSLLALCERERGTVPHFVLQCIWTVERRGTALGTGTAWGTGMGRWGQLRGQPAWEVGCWLLWAPTQLYWAVSPCATRLWASSRGQQRHWSVLKSAQCPIPGWIV